MSQSENHEHTINFYEHLSVKCQWRTANSKCFFFFPSLQWFPRARLPEPGTGGGGGAGGPVRAGRVPAPPCLPRQHLRFHHYNCLLLLLSPNPRHLPGLLLHSELWEFPWFPVTWAPGSPRLSQDEHWRQSGHDGGDQDERCGWQFSRGVWWTAACQGGGVYNNRVIQVQDLVCFVLFRSMSYGNKCQSRDGSKTARPRLETTRTQWFKLPEDFCCLSVDFHMQLRCTYLTLGFTSNQVQRRKWTFLLLFFSFFLTIVKFPIAEMGFQ